MTATAQLPENKVFRNEELEKVVNLAKENGLKVFTFESSSKYIGQVFITDGTEIGSCQADYSGVRFSTQHKPCHECGTGFGLQSDHIINADLSNIKESFGMYPRWATPTQRKAVIKYASADEYTSKERILKYYYI